MSQVHERNGEIIFTEKVSNKLRIFLSIIGLFPMIYVPYKLIIQPDWNEFSIYLFFSIVISIGAFLLGSLFLVAGLLGLNKTLIFSKDSKSVIHSYSSILQPFRKETYNFNDIDKLTIITHNWTEGPSSHSLQITLKNGKKILFGTFEKKKEAEQYLAKINNLMQ